MRGILMTIDVLMSQLFNFSKPTYFRWKKEGRPIIKLIDQYFKKEDLIEFLETGSISKFELLPDVTQVTDEIKKKLRDTLIRFLGKFDEKDFTFKIENICWAMSEQNEQITLSNLLIFLNTSCHDNCHQELKAIEKIAYTAAISSLSEFEFKIARRYSLL